MHNKVDHEPNRHDKCDVADCIDLHPRKIKKAQHIDVKERNKWKDKENGSPVWDKDHCNDAHCNDSCDCRKDKFIDNNIVKSERYYKD